MLHKIVKRQWFDDWLETRDKGAGKAMDHALMLAQEMEVIMTLFIEMGNPGGKADLGWGRWIQFSMIKS